MATLAGKVIAITGAASGMGHAFAKLAGSQGARLAIADIQKKRLEDLRSELKTSGIEAEASVIDIGSRSDVDDWISSTMKHFGRIDSAANIAGILGPFGNFVDSDNEMWNKIIGTNLFGTMNCLHAQLKVMGKGATIVNMASVTGVHSQPGLAVYSVSKHGIVGLTKTVAKELEGTGIRINAVAPGPIDTPMARSLYETGSTDGEPLPDGMGPMKRFGKPEEVAKVVAFLLGDDSSFMHGHVTYVDGGFEA